MDKKPLNKYYPELDSLRGFAVISVILWHYWQCLNDNFSLILKPYLFFMYGAGAVILFFVLSGFVLACSYDKSNGYIDYLVRRVFRIYPAYYVALFISVLGLYFLTPTRLLWLSNAFNLWQGAVINTSSIANAIILINPKFFNLFVTPSWSLTIEMIVSVFFPLLLLLSRGRHGNIFMILYISIIYFLNSYQSKYLLTLPVYYSIYFALGILIFKNLKELKLLGTIWLLPFYICCYAGIFFSKSFANILYDTQLLTGFGAFGIILVSIHSTIFNNLLQFSVLRFIGKLSYSIYLLHMPILLILIYILKDVISRDDIYGLYFISFVSTICFSYLSYKYIETPFILLGSKIYSCFKIFRKEYNK